MSDDPEMKACPLRCADCGTAVVWEKANPAGGKMVCSCSSTEWEPGEGMMPWEDGYADRAVLVLLHATRSNTKIVELLRDMRALLHRSDYYIAGLQAVQRRVRVTDLDERHVGYDRLRSKMLTKIDAELAHIEEEG